jgi:cell division protein FtsQ
MKQNKGTLSYHSFQFVLQTGKFLLLGLLVLAVIFGLNHFRLSHYFPIKTVRIYGANRLDHQEVQALVLPFVTHGFFNTNVDNIRGRLQVMPWVSDIFVRRQWPNQIDITVVERRAIANWNQEGLLSAGGVVFSPNQTSYPTNVPQFMGPEGKQVLMLQYHDEINRLLSPLHAKISYLELSPYLSWKVVLDNGMTLQLGHKDILTRLSHFVKVYPKMMAEHATKDVDYVDLRYPNGVAVRWKAPVKI